MHHSLFNVTYKTYMHLDFSRFYFSQEKNAEIYVYDVHQDITAR